MAKINICLQVLNKREDGFHNINSLFYRIPLCDEIIISESNELDFSCNINLGIAKEDNLVYKAAIELLKNIHKSYTAKIELIKNIPSGAGLGGGSSNAAEALIVLNEFWHLGLRHSEILPIAEKLGSDVPFFLYDSAAIVSGRGEVIKPIDFSLNCYCLILFPNIHVDTAKAYKLLKRNEDVIESMDIENIIRNINNLQDMKSILMNDFEEPIFGIYPKMKQIKEQLLELSNGLALMSGSGSAFFALFDNKSEAKQAKDKFKESDYFLYMCKLL